MPWLIEAIPVCKQCYRWQNHRITECSGLEGASVDRPIQPPCQSRVTQSRLHRTASRQILNISREGDSTASLGSLGQGSVTSALRVVAVAFALSPPPGGNSSSQKA